jgi:hypothetical protein
MDFSLLFINSYWKKSFNNLDGDVLVNNKYINKMPFYFCTKGEKDSNRGREESIGF